MNRIPDPRQRPWLSVKEVAQITGEGEKAIRLAIDAGQLPVLHIGRYVRIPTSALRKLVGIPEIDPPDVRCAFAGLTAQRHEVKP